MKYNLGTLYIYKIKRKGVIKFDPAIIIATGKVLVAVGGLLVLLMGGKK